MEGRVCRTCLIQQDLSQFGEYKIRGVKRRRKECKSCRRKKEAKRYAENPEVRDKMKQRAAAYHLMSRYGLTENCVAEMITIRDNKCDICKNELVKPNVYHCHSSGLVRGLLCWDCNIGLGKFRDNITYLKSAIEYLEEN